MLEWGEAGPSEEGEDSASKRLPRNSCDSELVRKKGCIFQEASRYAAQVGSVPGMEPWYR